MLAQRDLLHPDTRADSTALPIPIRKDGAARDSVEVSIWQGRKVLTRQYLIGWAGRPGTIAISADVTAMVDRYARLDLADSCRRHGLPWTGQVLKHTHEGPVGRIVSLVLVSGTPTEVQLRAELIPSK